MNLGSYDIIVIVLLLHGSNFKAFVVFGVLQNQSYSLLLHVLLFFWANDFRGFALLVLEWRREQVQNPATIRWHTEAVTGFNWEQESGQWRADAEYMARFFYYESYKGLVVKWKRHNGGLVLKNLIYIFWSSFVYILIIWSERYKFVFSFVLNWRFFTFSYKKVKSQFIYTFIHVYIYYNQWIIINIYHY